MMVGTGSNRAALWRGAGAGMLAGFIAAAGSTAEAALLQERECWTPATRHVTGLVTTRSGSGADERMIITRSRAGTELCRRSVGEVEYGEDGRITALANGAWVVLATRTAGATHTLVLTPGPQELQHAWYVNGVAQPFDADAREWRDALQAVLHVESAITQLRGQDAGLRGRISSLRGQETSMRGQIASVRGQVASMEGQIASLHGREASLRGQIASLRARKRGTSDDTDRRVRELEQRIRELDVDARTREIRSRIDAFDADARTRALEARIAAFDLEGQVRGVEQQIEALDADRRIRAFEPLREPAHARLEAALRRLR